MSFKRNKPKFSKSTNDNYKKRKPTDKSFNRNKENSWGDEDKSFGEEDFSEEKQYKKNDRTRFDKKDKSKSFDKKFDKSKESKESYNKKEKSDYDAPKSREDKSGKFEKKNKPYKKTFDRYKDDSRPSELSVSKVSRSFDKPKFDKPKFDKFSKRDKFRNNKKDNKSESFQKQSHSKSSEGGIRLNKYIANAGICSRREADDLIASGAVSVNGKIITEMGFRIKPTDIIKYGGQTLKKEKMVYVLLNKPKDYISTVDDPEKRKTVIELVRDACRERIYPVGRLDRATTGLLLLTNDGELTKKLTHPKYGVKKVYFVELDKPLKHTDMEKIQEGIELEDGFMKVDEINYVGDGANKKEIGIELHSGKNRIVRRLFEHIGYNVRKLDRVMFGPLTKKDLPRGRWRHLSAAEIGMLNMVKS